MYFWEISKIFFFISEVVFPSVSPQVQSTLEENNVHIFELIHHIPGVLIFLHHCYEQFIITHMSEGQVLSHICLRVFISACICLFFCLGYNF